MIDFPQLLSQYNIEYVTSGPNVARGNINIKCPWCGDNDPSQHLGIRLATGQFGCWRDPAHRGSRPYKLLNALLGLTYPQVEALINGSTLDNFLDNVTTALGEKPATIIPKPNHKALLPGHFRGNFGHGFGGRFIDYLVKQRKFNVEDVPKLIDEYHLMYSLKDKWAWRLIIPVFFDGEIVAWTGRHIRGAAKRYESSGTWEGENIKDTLLHFDSLSKDDSKILVINEGPFDSIKVDFYGKAHGIRATCLFGIGISESQFYLLDELKNRYEKLVLMLDSTAPATSLELANKFYALHLHSFHLPNTIKDGGDLSKAEVEDLAEIIHDSRIY